MTVVIRRSTDVNYRTVTSPQGPSSATVGLSSAQILPFNSARAGLIIVNLSPNNVYLGLGTGAVANSGLTLLPNFGWKMDDFTFCVDAIFAVADQADSVISIQEFNV